MTCIEWLKSRRLELGQTQQQVADAAGMTQRQYVRYESGDAQLSQTETNNRLAMALGIDPDYFNATASLERGCIPQFLRTDPIFMRKLYEEVENVYRSI